MFISRLARVSKQVGWDKPAKEKLVYPERKEVLYAINHQQIDKYAEKIFSWNRFLPSPVNKLQRNLIDLIIAGMDKLK